MKLPAEAAASASHVNTGEIDVPTSITLKASGHTRNLSFTLRTEPRLVSQAPVSPSDSHARLVLFLSRSAHGSAARGCASWVACGLKSPRSRRVAVRGAVEAG